MPPSSIRFPIAVNVAKACSIAKWERPIQSDRTELARHSERTCTVTLFITLLLFGWHMFVLCSALLLLTSALPPTEGARHCDMYHFTHGLTSYDFSIPRLTSKSNSKASWRLSQSSPTSSFLPNKYFVSLGYFFIWRQLLYWAISKACCIK